MNIKISKRLKTIGDLVKDKSNVVDIGCDHGLLSIYIAQTKKNINVIASDINELPLKQARKNIEKYDMQNHIKVIQSDGLKNIKDNYDTIIISGLGGNVICDILKEIDDNIKQIIICPQNNTYKTRKYIFNLGFIIKDEIIVKENNKLYVIINFVRSNKKIKYTKNELLYGPILLKNKSELFIEYLDKVFNKQLYIYSKLPNTKFFKKIKVKNKIKKIKKIR